MKKRIFFIAISIIEIVVFCYLIFSANEILQEDLSSVEEIYSIFSQEMRDKMIETYTSSGVNILRFFSIIGIGLNLITLYITIKNTILRNKDLLIIFSILHIIFGMLLINQLLAVISILVLLCLKRVNPEDFPIKEKLPELEEEKLNKKEIILGTLLVLIYFSQFIWKQFIPEEKNIKIAISIAFYVVVFILSVAYWNKKLLNKFKIFRKKFIAYIKFILPRMVATYVVVFSVAIISTIITGEASSVNQEILEKMKSYIVIPLAIIWAPVVEETIFRGLIHKLIKNKYLYIIISASVFGLLHTVGLELTIINTVIKALPYAVLGGFLAYIYDKTNNISTSMFGHALINTICSIVIFI